MVIISVVLDERKQASKSVMPYMQNFRDKVQCSLHIMHNKKRTAQEKAKEHYDKFAREVCCEPGDLVLVLQPLAGKPLSLKYVGVTGGR